jgi:hypothetical protein
LYHIEYQYQIWYFEVGQAHHATIPALRLAITELPLC